MQTAQINLSVSQLANLALPTIKAKPTKDLSVRRHDKKMLHTRTHAGGFLHFESGKARQQRHFKLYKNPEDDFIQTIPSLFAHLENIKVVFHNTDYIEAVFDTYYNNYAHLFLEWVKTFARIRKAHRAELMDKIIQSTEDDFLSAFQLFKMRSIKPKKKQGNQKVKVWQTILKNFAEKPFTNRDIEEQTLIYCSTVGHYLKMLKEEGKLKRVKKIGGRLRYKLI